MRANYYKLISRAVEEGIAYGYARAFKHTVSPSEDQIRDSIFNAIMNELSEVIKWSEDA